MAGAPDGRPPTAAPARGAADGRRARPRCAGRGAAGRAVSTCCPGWPGCAPRWAPSWPGPAWELARLRARARPVFGADADRAVPDRRHPRAGRAARARRPAGRPAAGRRGGSGRRPGLRRRHRHGRARPGGRRGRRRRPRPGRAGADRRQRRRARASPAGCGWSTPTSSTWWPARRRPGGRVRGRDLDPARRAGGRRQLDPDRWSPPWSTVAALLDAVPATRGEGGARPRPRPGAGRHRGRVGVGRRLDRRGAAVGPRTVAPPGAGRRLVADGGVLEVTAAADPGPAPVGAVRGWLHEPDPALIRSGLVSLVAADLGATLIDPTIAYLTSDAPGRLPVGAARTGSPRSLPFNLKKLRALLRARGIGRVDGEEARLADRARDAGPAAARPGSAVRRRRGHPGGRGPDRTARTLVTSLGTASMRSG